MTVILLAVVAAIAAYAVQTSRQRLVRLALLDADVDRLVDHVLPTLASRLREGVPAVTTLAGLSHLVNGDHQRILRVAADEIGRSERMHPTRDVGLRQRRGSVGGQRYRRVS